MNNIIDSYFEKVVKMNELFLKYANITTLIKCYKISDELFIIKLILWSKQTLCFIVKNETVMQFWKADDDYIILIDNELKTIKTYTSNNGVISFDLEIFKEIKPIDYISYMSFFPTWDVRII